MAVFNAENTAHKTGDYPLFLGQQMGMYDSINKKYPQLFELYKNKKNKTGQRMKWICRNLFQIL